MSDQSITINGFDDYRGVSQIIAVGLLILVAVGFAIAIDRIGRDVIGSYEDRPSAKIEPELSEENIRLSVQRVEDVDQLNTGSGAVLSNHLKAQAGSSVTIDYDGDTRDGDPLNNQYGAGSQITVRAVEGVDRSNTGVVVYRYPIPEGTDMGSAP